MSILKNCVGKALETIGFDQEWLIGKRFLKRYRKHSFKDGHCKDEKQYEASIIRWYHTIEKGLAYVDYRPGFGQRNIDILVSSMEEYSQKYDVNSSFYQTALSVLYAYIEKNKKFGHVNPDLNNKIKNLPGVPNNKGGILEYTPSSKKELEEMKYHEFIASRHSMRHFSELPVDEDIISIVLHNAQLTPSACNRQGWKTYVITDKATKENILKNQNGNNGFGGEIDKLLVVAGDLRCFNRDREVHQVFIDCGMYAMRVLDCFHAEGIATIPLSASLTTAQELKVRSILGMSDSEVLILFIGIGNYPEICQTTRSARSEPNVVYIHEKMIE